MGARAARCAQDSEKVRGYIGGGPGRFARIHSAAPFVFSLTCTQRPRDRDFGIGVGCPARPRAPGACSRKGAQGARVLGFGARRDLEGRGRGFLECNMSLGVLYIVVY